MSLSCLGIVLAGGRSARMGTDKARLQYRGTTLLDYMVRLLGSLPLDRVIVSGDRPGYDCLPDAPEHSGAGPACAIEHVIGALPDYDRYLVVPVDMPGLTTGWLAPLIPTGGYYAGYPLPLCFPGPADPKKRASGGGPSGGPSGGLSVRSLIAAYGVSPVPLPGPGEGGPAQRPRVLDNCNTPAEWAAWAAGTD